MVCGPNDEDNMNKFWEEITVVVEEAKGIIFILGDFNSRVGIRDVEDTNVLGTNGKIVRNRNGRKMLDSCMIHNLVITNMYSFPKKRDTQI